MKSKLKAVVAAAAACVLLAACGGDSSSDNNAGNTPGGNTGGTNIDPSLSVQSVFDYISKLIADNGENSTPVDVNGVTLAVDDTSPPVAFSP